MIFTMKNMHEHNMTLCYLLLISVAALHCSQDVLSETTGKNHNDEEVKLEDVSTVSKRQTNFQNNNNFNQQQIPQEYFDFVQQTDSAGNPLPQQPQFGQENGGQPPVFVPGLPSEVFPPTTTTTLSPFTREQIRFQEEYARRTLVEQQTALLRPRQRPLTQPPPPQFQAQPTPTPQQQPLQFLDQNGQLRQQNFVPQQQNFVTEQQDFLAAPQQQNILTVQGNEPFSYAQVKFGPVTDQQQQLEPLVSRPKGQRSVSRPRVTTNLAVEPVTQQTVDYPVTQQTVDYQGTQRTIDYQSNQGMIDYQDNQGTVDYQGNQGTVDYQGNQGTVDYLGNQGSVDYLGSQGTVDYQGNHGTGGHQDTRQTTAGLDYTPTTFNPAKISARLLQNVVYIQPNGQTYKAIEDTEPVVQIPRKNNYYYLQSAPIVSGPVASTTTATTTTATSPGGAKEDERVVYIPRPPKKPVQTSRQEGRKTGRVQQQQQQQQQQQVTRTERPRKQQNYPEQQSSEVEPDNFLTSLLSTLQQQQPQEATRESTTAAPKQRAGVTQRPQKGGIRSESSKYLPDKSQLQLLQFPHELKSLSTSELKVLEEASAQIAAANDKSVGKKQQQSLRNSRPVTKVKTTAPPPPPPTPPQSSAEFDERQQPFINNRPIPTPVELNEQQRQFLSTQGIRHLYRVDYDQAGNVLPLTYVLALDNRPNRAEQQQQLQ